MKTKSKSSVLAGLSPLLLLFLAISYASLVSSLCAQDIAATYTQAANSFRQAAAKTTGQQAACYLQWASYYDCLAAQLGSGSSAKCAPPTCNVNADGSANSVIDAKLQRALDRAAQIAKNYSNTQKGIQGGFNSLGNLLQQGLQQQQDREQEQQNARIQDRQDRDAARLSQALGELDNEMARLQQLQATEPADGPVGQDNSNVPVVAATADDESLANLLKTDGLGEQSGSPSSVPSATGTPALSSELDTAVPAEGGKSPTAAQVSDSTEAPGNQPANEPPAQSQLASNDSSAPDPSQAEATWHSDLSEPVGQDLQHLMDDSEQSGKAEAVAQEAQQEGIDAPSGSDSDAGNNSLLQALYDRAKDRAMDWAMNNIPVLGGKPYNELSDDDKQTVGAIADVGTHALGIYQMNPVWAAADPERFVTTVPQSANQAVGGVGSLINRVLNQINNATNAPSTGP